MSLQSSLDEAIDIVVAWVNGSDLDYRSKLNYYVRTCADSSLSSEEYSSQRYEATLELNYCLHSILRNAPFVRKIFLLTDSQSPLDHVDTMIVAAIDAGRICLVDHLDIFKGYEEYLPTFNSLSIETMIHRIPGLANKYIYLNDDFFLLRHVSSEDFFRDGIPVSSGFPAQICSLRVRYDLRKALSSRTVGFVNPMVNSWRILSATHGIKRFVRLYHAPYVFSKLTVANFFSSNEDYLRANISHRFRSYSQFSTASLAASIEFSKTSKALLSTLRHIYLKPVCKPPGYSLLKLFPYYASRSIKFGCIQSFSAAKMSDQQFLEKWLQRNILAS